MAAVAGLAVLVLAGCGFIAPEPTPTPTSTPTATPEPPPVAEVPLVRTTQQLNVRNGASDNCAIIGQYAANTEVPVKAITPAHDWWQVEYGDQKVVGWMYAGYTTPVNDVTNVPELPGPPCGLAPAAPQPPPQQPTQEPTEEPTQQGAVCGNGTIETGEACDGSGCPQGQQCNASCQCEPVPPQNVCGNGIVEAGEQCDGSGCGFSQFCNASCQCEFFVLQLPVCGNGVKEAGEECDGGGCGLAEVCLANCTCQPFVIQQP